MSRVIFTPEHHTHCRQAKLLPDLLSDVTQAHPRLHKARPHLHLCFREIQSCGFMWRGLTSGHFLRNKGQIKLSAVTASVPLIQTWFCTAFFTVSQFYSERCSLYHSANKDIYNAVIRQCLLKMRQIDGGCVLHNVCLTAKVHCLYHILIH